MNKTLNQQFLLQAVINGKTLITDLVVTNGKALAQYVDQNGNVSPDWETDTSSRPQFKASVKQTIGTVEKSLPNYEKLYWEGNLVSFDSNGLSTAISGLLAAGTFRRTADADSTYTYTICKNLFTGAAGEDSDLLRIEGKIALAGGRTQDFVTPETEVTLLRYSVGGTPYLARITEVKNITTGSNGQPVPGELTAALFDLSNNMQAVSSGFTLKWYNLDGAGTKTECTAADGYTISGSKLTIPEGKVNGYDVFMAEFSVNGSVVATATAPVIDETDNIFAGFDIEGLDAGYLPEGGTALVSVFVCDADGNALTQWGNKTLYPHLVLKGCEGGTVTPTPFSGTKTELRALTTTSSIHWKGEAWSGLLRVPYNMLVASPCLGRLQGWITIDETA